VVDIASLDKIADINTGPLPISLAYSPLSNAIYVADGQTGELAVISGDTREVITRIETSPGLGPMRFSEDGRWGILLNPQKNQVYVIRLQSTISHFRSGLRALLPTSAHSILSAFR
jgi:DNA-binding beta-propeller fold protein YncE